MKVDFKFYVQKKKNPNDTLDIIYEITMGDKAVINEIKFIGDKKFKSKISWEQQKAIRDI